MNVSTETIDRIVANVLNQISTGGERVETGPVDSTATIPTEVPQPLAVQRLSQNVITADLLQQLEVGKPIQISKNAIITPAAKDYIREQRLFVERCAVTITEKESGRQTAKEPSARISIAIVRHTKNLSQAIAELGEVNKELLSCPDDAAKFAISEICRNGAGSVLIFAEQTHRAACLANRNDKVKAVAIRDNGDVKSVKKQIRANVWCLDPSERSYFELKNILKVIRSEASK